MPTNSMHEELSIFSQIHSKHHGVSISKIWISEQLRNGITSPDQIYKTWLITDITDTNAECLPPEATNMEIAKSEFAGPFTLQVISVMDVGSSCYSQLKKLSGNPVPTNTQNSSFHNTEPPPSKMMLLTLTDGMNVITAMEYQPCPQITVKLLPGCKMVVSNVTVRIGMLLLQPGNFRILGGCVESLRSIYKQEQVLRSALEGDEDGDEEMDVGNVGQVVQASTEQDVRVTSTSNVNPMSSGRAEINALRYDHDNVNNRERLSSNEAIDSKPKADMSCNNNISKSTSSKGILTKVSSSKPTPKQTDSSNFDTKLVVPSAPTQTTPQGKGSPLSGFLDSLTAEFFEPIDEPVPDSTFTIKDLHKGNKDLAFPVQVNATISSLCSKLSPVPEWTVQARLSDFSGHLECRLSESVLSKMIGFTSQNFSEMKQVSATNPSVKSFMRQGLESCQKQLTFLTGTFSLQLNTLNFTGTQFEVVSLQQLPIDQESKLKNFVKSGLNCPSSA